MRKSTKKEETTKKALSNNVAGLLGYIREIQINDLEDKGRKAIHLVVVTQENWKDEKGEAQKRNTYHRVDFLTDNKEAIEKFEAVAQKLEGENPEFTAVRVKGKLITRDREVENGVYHNTVIAADSVELDAKRLDKEARNAIDLKGNIARIDMHDGFAVVSVATKYYVPGESQNFKGETKPYTEKTAFVEGVINEKHRPETFKALSDGTIAVGDLVKTRGQMYNDSYEDKQGKKQYAINIVFNKIDIVAKKGEKKAEAQEAKVEEKPAKKAVAKRKKGMTL